MVWHHIYPPPPFPCIHSVTLLSCLSCCLMVNILFFIAFIHIFAGAIYNKYRIQQLLQHISRCRGRELTEAEFVVLLRGYTSLSAPMRFSPSRSLYPMLYTNETFAAFAQQSKHVMVYIYAVVIPCMLMWMVLS